MEEKISDTEKIKNSIKICWHNYQNATIGMDENESWALEYGWKDGFKRVLTELLLNDEISNETYKKYIDKLLH